jgi:hypothetical protein
MILVISISAITIVTEKLIFQKQMRIKSGIFGGMKKIKMCDSIDYI